MKWMLALGIFWIGAAWGDPQSDLLASFVTLRNAVQNNLNFANQQCDKGKQKQCQYALMSTALLGTIDAEIALNRLRTSELSEEAADKIHRALRNLDDAESDINHASEALQR
jgi:hypothetical protein